MISDLIDLYHRYQTLSQDRQFIIIGLLLATIAVLLYGYATRNVSGDTPGIRGVRPIYTNSITLLLCVAAGGIVALILARTVHWALDWVDFDPESNAKLYYLNFAFLIAIMGGILWETATAPAKVPLGSLGVPRFLQRRLRSFELSEGNHRLLKVFDSAPVDMRAKPEAFKEPLEFDERTKDGRRVRVKITRARSIRWPRDFLDIGVANDGTPGADAILDGYIESRSRTYILERDEPELYKSDSKNGMATWVRDEVLKMPRVCEYLVESRDPNNITDTDRARLQIIVEDIAPPKVETDAAAQATANMIRLDNYIERLKKWRAAWEAGGVSAQDILASFERLEGTREADEFIISGVELAGASDAFLAMIAEALRGRSRRGGQNRRQGGQRGPQNQGGPNT